MALREQINRQVSPKIVRNEREECVPKIIRFDIDWNIEKDKSATPLARYYLQHGWDSN